MKRNKTQEAVYRQIADNNSLPVSEVRKAVFSFFDAVTAEARRLPFDTPKKIYSNSVFKKHSVVFCLPYIGRLGTSYSRYLKWRANESAGINMVSRASYKKGLSREDIETIANNALKGEKYEKPESRTVPYQRIWMVREDGKKQARQVIPKNNV